HDVVPPRNERLVADGLAVNDYALVDANKVRARQKTSAQPVGAQKALDDAARARFAVRAGQVDDRVRLLRIAQQLDGTARWLKPGARRRLPHAGEQLAIDGVGLGLQQRVVRKLR